MDGVPLAKAFRHREIMLLQAVAEKYHKVSTVLCLANLGFLLPEVDKWFSYFFLPDPPFGHLKCTVPMLNKFISKKI